jgi:hypothetical protein
MKNPFHSSSMGSAMAAIALGAFAAPSGSYACDQSGDQFTIAVISDTQNYVDDLKPQPDSSVVFEQETRYLARTCAST